MVCPDFAVALWEPMDRFDTRCIPGYLREIKATSRSPFFLFSTSPRPVSGSPRVVLP